jgi:FtsH-binding integral membrane protein
MGIILSLIGLFGLLFVAMMFSDQFPLNILFVSLFAAFMGWIISPTIHGL